MPLANGLHTYWRSWDWPAISEEAHLLNPRSVFSQHVPRASLVTDVFFLAPNLSCRARKKKEKKKLSSTSTTIEIVRASILLNHCIPPSPSVFFKQLSKLSDFQTPTSQSQGRYISQRSASTPHQRPFDFLAPTGIFRNNLQVRDVVDISPLLYLWLAVSGIACCFLSKPYMRLGASDTIPPSPRSNCALLHLLVVQARSGIWLCFRHLSRGVSPGSAA